MASSRTTNNNANNTSSATTTEASTAILFVLHVILVLVFVVLVVRLLCSHASVNMKDREMFQSYKWKSLENENGYYYSGAEGIPAYLGYPTKCFSCERQFPPGQEWRGQSTKCFSCERHAPDAQSTHPSKCLSCGAPRMGYVRY